MQLDVCRLDLERHDPGPRDISDLSMSHRASRPLTCADGGRQESSQWQSTGYILQPSGYLLRLSTAFRVCAQPFFSFLLLPTCDTRSSALIIALQYGTLHFRVNIYFHQGTDRSVGLKITNRLAAATTVRPEA